MRGLNPVYFLTSTALHGQPWYEVGVNVGLSILESYRISKIPSGWFWEVESEGEVENFLFEKQFWFLLCVDVLRSKL